MKLIKPIFLGVFAVAGLWSCDRGPEQQREEEISVSERDNWHGNMAAPSQQREELGEDDFREFGPADAGATKASPAATKAHGAISDDDLSEDTNADTARGTGASEDDRYLDNTSSEADLNEEDRGRVLGREPSHIDNTSSESDQGSAEDL